MPFRIERNDITLVSADCIVNTADPEPIVGWGTDTAVHRKAGPALLSERKKIGYIEPGDAEATPAFGLDAKYVMHTVSPVWTGGGGGEVDLLRRAYDTALYKAKDLGCTSIAFPLMAAGNLGFPRHIALKTAIDAFTAFLMENDMDIVLVVFDDDTYRLSGRLSDSVASFIDENYINAAVMREYSSEEIRELNDNLIFDEEWLSLEMIRRGQAGDKVVQRHLNQVLKSYPLLREIIDGDENWDLPPDLRRGELDDDEDGCYYSSEYIDDNDYTFGDIDRMVELEARKIAEDQEKRQEEDFLRGSCSLRQTIYDPDYFAAENEGRDLDEFTDEKESTGYKRGKVSYRKAQKQSRPDMSGALFQAPLYSRDTLGNMVHHLDMGFSDFLRELIVGSGMAPSEVYKKANIDRKLFSKIMNNPGYQPSKPTAIAFALALGLDMEGTSDLIRRAGYAMTHSSMFDIIVEYCIRNGIYNILEVNTILFEYDLPLIGNGQIK